MKNDLKSDDQQKIESEQNEIFKKEKNDDLLYVLKNSNNKMNKVDVTLDVLELLLLRRLNRSQVSNNSGQNQKSNSEDKSSTLGNFIKIFSFISLAVFLIITFINRTSKNSFSFNNYPFKIHTNISEFGNIKCIGKKDHIDNIIYFLNRICMKIDEGNLKNLNKCLRPPDKNFLLYGEPGTGKTLLVRKLCYYFDLHLKLKEVQKEYSSLTELKKANIPIKELNKKPSQLVFITADPSDFVSKFVGDTEKNIEKMFFVSRKFVDEGKVVIIFIDEIDTFFKDRDNNTPEYSANLKSQFLSILDGAGTRLTDKIFFFGATNLADQIDSAFLRRLANHIHFEAPNDAERELIIKESVGTNIFFDEARLEAAVKASRGLTQSDFIHIFSELENISLGGENGYTYEDMMDIFRSCFNMFGVKHGLSKNASNIKPEKTGELNYNKMQNYINGTSV